MHQYGFARIGIRFTRSLIPASLLVLGPLGCAASIPNIDMSIPRLTSGWYADYGSAEDQAHQTGRPMLIYFKGAAPWKPDSTEDAVKSAEVAARTDNMVRCVLIRSFEPDRRYVGQFNVERAPALILVHSDGTFHARTGAMNPPEILSFLDQAVSPGEVPKSYTFLRRPVQYSWLRTLEEAESAGRETDRPVLVVLDRPYSRDWERLSLMLHRREVFQRFSEMVHCRPNALWKFGRTAEERYGLSGLPAIAILQPDGTFQALPMPSSYESIIRFADRVSAESAIGPQDSKSHADSSGS